MNIKAEIGAIQEKHGNVPKMQYLSSSHPLAPPERHFMSPFCCFCCSSTLLQAWVNFSHWERFGYGCGGEPAKTSVWQSYLQGPDAGDGKIGSYRRAVRFSQGSL